MLKTFKNDFVYYFCTNQTAHDKKITNNWVVYIKPVTQQGQSTVFMARTFLSTFDFDGNSYAIQNSLAYSRLVNGFPPNLLE